MLTTRLLMPSSPNCSWAEMASATSLPVASRMTSGVRSDLGINLYGDGEQSRDFVFVSDVVEVFLKALIGSQEAIYNVGTGRASSINAMIRALVDICGTPLAIESKPAWPNDIRTIRADISRLQDEFGFRPKVTLAEGLHRTVDFFRDGAA